MQCFTRNPPRAPIGGVGFKRNELNWPWFIDVSNTGDIAVADTDNHRIQVFNSRSQECVFPPYGTKGTGPGQLYMPRSVKYTPIPGINFAVCDTGNRRVVLLKINFRTGELETVSEFGQTYFREPTDIAIDWRTGHLFVTDTSLNRVTIHERDGTVISECRPPSHHPFYQPMGIACDEQGRVFVTDTGNNAVKVFKTNGDFVEHIGGLGTGMGEFNRPKGICIDSRGYIFIADEGNSRIQMWSSDLRYRTEVVTDIPIPKGVAAHKQFKDLANQLYVTTGDQYNFIKTYNA